MKLKRGFLVFTSTLLLAGTIACGVKAPPLPPDRTVPQFLNETPTPSPSPTIPKRR